MRHFSSPFYCWQLTGLSVYIHRRLNPDGTPVGPARLNILPSDAMDYDNEYPVENIYTTNKFASSASMDEEVGIHRSVHFESDIFP